MKHKTAWGIEGVVFWQAHRGGGGFERPDNTLISAHYAWDLGGAAELDIRTTADGQIICLHDPTLRRTTDAPGTIADIPVASLPYASFAHVDAGAKFSPAFTGARVPLLRDIFAEMSTLPEARVYLDLKNINLERLANLIAEYGLEERVWVAGPERQYLADMKCFLPAVGTMQWIGGESGYEIESKFLASASAGFAGLSQIQLHLNDKIESENAADATAKKRVRNATTWRYTIGPEFISSALALCSEAKIDLEVFPWKFDEGDLFTLLDLGVRWFATDEPERFSTTVRRWLSKKNGT